MARLLRLLFPSATLKIYGRCVLPESVVALLASFCRALGSVNKVENFSTDSDDLCLHVECSGARGPVWVTACGEGKYLIHSLVQPLGVGVPPDMYLPVAGPRSVTQCVEEVRRLLSGMETGTLTRSLTALLELSAAPSNVDLGTPFVVPFIALQRTATPSTGTAAARETARLLRQVGVTDMLLLAPGSEMLSLVKKAVHFLAKTRLGRRGEGVAILSEPTTATLLIIYPRLGLATSFTSTGGFVQKSILMAPRLFEVYPETNKVTVPVTSNVKMQVFFRDERDIKKLRSLLADLLDIVTAEAFEKKAMRILGRDNQ